MQVNIDHEMARNDGRPESEALMAHSIDKLEGRTESIGQPKAFIVSAIASPSLGARSDSVEPVPQAPQTHHLIIALKSSPSTSRTQTLHSDSHKNKGILNLSQPRPGPNPLTIKQDSETFSSMSETQNNTVPPIQPRKRGRPKGWKPGQPYAEIKGGPKPRDCKKGKPKKPTQSAAGSSGNEAKRRGRPPKAPEFPARHYYLKARPKFTPFRCEWHDSGICCPAELQNMDTLRRHVYIVHAATHPDFCSWGKCVGRVPEFKFGGNASVFHNHMEKEHLGPYVWHMGDGIQNRGVSTLEEDPTKLPAYLFDKNGNQVTPSVRDQQFENTAGMLQRKRKLREIRRLANENAPDEEEYVSQILGKAVLDA